MRLRTKFFSAVVLGFIFAGGFSGTYAAMATAQSNTVNVVGWNSFCAKTIAISNTDPSERAQLNVTAYSLCATGGTSPQPSGYIGSNVALKTTSGAVCSSVGTTYSTSTTAYKSSMAYWSSSACGTGVQLSAAGTGYAYTGSGYNSGTAQAPYQVYP